MPRRLYPNGVLGFRHWLIDHAIGPGPIRRLCSITRPALWNPGRNMAKCIDRNPPYLFHEPDEMHNKCTCGLYANHERHRSSGFIEGAVALWGDVHVYAEGIRGKFGKIIALTHNFEMPSIEPIARELAESYGVRYVEPEYLEDFARDRASGIPLEQRPWLKCWRCEQKVRYLTTPTSHGRLCKECAFEVLPFEEAA